MKSMNSKFGLVLTGGGAKGAYQVGALNYLAEIGFQPHIISGSSIGALNSAVLSAYTPFNYAVERLDQFWNDIALIKPIQINSKKFIKPSNTFFIPTFHSIVKLLDLWDINPDNYSFLDPAPMENFIRQKINPAEIRNGIELWITVFPCIKILGIEIGNIFELVRAKSGSETHWICAQDLNDDQAIYNLILASAALPWAFPRRKIGKTTYIDGGLADNVPLKPLAERGCDYVVVIHLENGSIWDRQKFSEQTIIEIRPQQTINKSDAPLLGMVSTFLDWSPERIMDLKQRGYNDAKYCFEPIFETLNIVTEQRKNIKIVESTMSLINSTQKMIDDEPLP